MRFKGSLILFLVAAVLSLYYAFVERPRQRALDASRVEGRRLAAIDPDAVIRLTVARPDGAVEFRAAASRWDMVRPERDVAEAGAVMTLLSAISQAEVARNLGRQDNREPYGLTDPVVVTAWWSERDSLVLHVGGYTVDRSNVYASLGPDGDVLLAPTGLRRYALVSVDDFRNKRVVAFDPAFVDSFTVSSSARTTRWARAGKTRWVTVERGDTIAGDTPAVEALLRELRGLRVRRFPGAGETLGLFPDADAVVRSGGAAPYVAIYKPPPAPNQIVMFAATAAGVLSSVVEHREDLSRVPGNARVVEVDSTVMSIFTRSVAELRDRRLLHFDRERLARVALASSDTIATLVRAGRSWTYPNPGLGAMEMPRVDAVLDAIAGLSARRVVSERYAPALLGGEPTLTLALYDEGGTLMDELVCRRLDGGGATALATSRSSDFVAEVDGEDLSALVESFRRINR